MNNLILSPIATDELVNKVSSDVIRKLQMWGFRPVSHDESPESLITREQAANLLNVSLATIDNYRSKGLLPFHRLGNVVRFKTSEVLEAFQEIGK